MRRRMELFDWLGERVPGFDKMKQEYREMIAQKYLRGDCLVVRQTPPGEGEPAAVIYAAKPKQRPQ